MTKENPKIITYSKLYRKHLERKDTEKRKKEAYKVITGRERPEPIKEGKVIYLAEYKKKE